MLDFEPIAGGGIRVRTDKGVYEAGRLVLSPGAFIGSVLPQLAATTQVKRQTQGWFAPARPADLAIGRLPVFTLMVPEGHFDGFPSGATQASSSARPIMAARISIPKPRRASRRPHMRR